MNNLKWNLSYVGEMSDKGRNYKIVENTTNGTINLFFIDKDKVSCWKLTKSKVKKTIGKDMLTKTKNYWNRMLEGNISEIEEPLVCDHYPMDFWYKVVMPISKHVGIGFQFEFQQG